MDAGARQHVERSGKHVLMDVRRAIEPDQHLDVKARVVIDHQLRLAKARLSLKRLRVIQQEMAKESREVHLIAGGLSSSARRAISGNRAGEKVGLFHRARTLRPSAVKISPMRPFCGPVRISDKPDLSEVRHASRLRAHLPSRSAKPSRLCRSVCGDTWLTFQDDRDCCLRHQTLRPRISLRQPGRSAHRLAVSCIPAERLHGAPAAAGAQGRVRLRERPS